MLPPNATGQPPPATRRDPHADLQLRRELALFRGLVESAVHAIVVVAQSGEIVLVNAAAEALSGYRREELVGQGVELLVPEAMRAQHAARRARFDAQQGVRPMGIGLDVVLRRKDGSDVPVEIGLGRVQTDDGFLISAAISDISERKRTEATIAELERERTRLAEATEYCSDAVISIDLEQRVRHWNRGAERLYGYTAQEALGRTLHELTVSTYEPREHVARMVSGEDVYQYETRRRRKDGTIVDILLTISPWHLEGKVVGVTGVAIDLREQKERERERERLAAAAEHGADAVVSIDRDGIVRHWSHGAERLYGFSSEEAVGKHMHALTVIGDELSDEVANVLATGIARQYEPRRRRKDGTIIDVLTTVLPWRVDGEIVGVTGVTIDVTQRKRAEQAAASLAAIVESSDDAIIAKTLDGRITSWNPAAERMYGYTAAEAIGRMITILSPSPVQDREIKEILLRVADLRRIDHFQTSRRRKDGSVIDVAVTVSPICNADGEVVGASSVARDITDRKRVADALAEAEARFRGAFEGAPIGMALVDLAARFGKVNDALCNLTGYGSEQLEGAALDTLLHPEDAGSVLGALRTTSDGEQTAYAGETRLVHAAGHPVWVALQLTLVRDRDGRPLRFIGQAQDITEQRRYEQRLQDLADHDALTGLLNRRSFSRELDMHAARVNRYGAEGALLVIDLDHFKYVNDTLGHQAGDELIRAASVQLRGRLRASDVLARLGGDEFAVLLPKADAPGAHRAALDLQQALAQQPAPLAGSGLRATTASIGIATFRPPLTGEEVFVNADLAMYDAKEAGRNRITVYDPDPGSQGLMKGRVSSVQRIRTALDQGRFTMLAQPIIDYRSGRTSQHELLLRMLDEHDELLPPGAFLGTAERLDLVQEIDAWVVQHAIGLLAGAGAAPQQLPLHVNLSGRSLGDLKLLELIERELKRTKVAPDRLIFEITETAAVRHITQARRFSERLAELGCGLALDDFGAGFGTFYYLKHLPFDYVKIDGEFVRNCRNDPADQTVIEALVAIARGLGKQTIAEFVEDEQTARLLAGLGVDYGQGYHHGRPAPVANHGRP